MDKQSIPDDYVRMQKCIYCGKDTGTILLNQQLKSIPEEQIYNDFCDECKKLFKDHRFFICKTCEKQGFIKKSILKKILTSESYKDTIKPKIIGFEKCPVCLGLIEPEKQSQ